MLSRMRRCLALLALWSTAHAADLPTPEAFLGHKVGADTKLADWATIQAYFRTLDKGSDRMSIRSIGKSTEGREMIVAEISSPGNLRNLNKIYERAAKLHDPRKIKDAKDEADLLKNAKTTILLNCSMHASEVAASQMSMELAHGLVTGQDQDTKDILENTVVQLVVCANPDGLDMVKSWYDRNLGTKFEEAPMPWLYQKYVGHDNNRDWWLISQQETINVSNYLYRMAFPTLLYDIHQMGGSGARLFVPPFHDPVNPNLDPIISQSIMMLGAHMANDLAAANKKGVVWGAIYDNWWQGGMRTTPQRHNIVAILTEAASARTASPVTMRPADLRGHDRGLPNYELRVNFPDPWPGGTWRLRDIVEYALITGRSMIRVGARYRGMGVRNQLQMARKQIALGDSEAPRSWIVERRWNPEGADQLVRSMMLAGGEVHQANKEFGVGELTYPAGTYVIQAAQPYRAHIKDLMERQKYPDRRVYPGGPVDRPYDVAGWTAPLCLGVDTLQVGARFNADLRLLDEIPSGKKAYPLGSLKPRVGLYKPWTASMDEGWTRFTFEQYGISFNSMTNEDMRTAGLNSKYDCIFIPGVSPNSVLNGVSAERMPAPYAGGIGTEGLENLKSFVEAGGTLVLMDESSGLASRLGIGIRNVLEGVSRDKFFCPGSILAVQNTAGHPLAAGMNEQNIAYFAGSQAFDVAQDAPVRVVARYAESNVLLSGFLLGEELIKGKACVVEATLGKGTVVAYAFPVQHRGQTMATFPYMWNAMRHSVQK